MNGDRSIMRLAFLVFQDGSDQRAIGRYCKTEMYSRKSGLRKKMEGVSRRPLSYSTNIKKQGDYCS